MVAMRRRPRASRCSTRLVRAGLVVGVDPPQVRARRRCSVRPAKTGGDARRRRGSRRAAASPCPCTTSRPSRRSRGEVDQPVALARRRRRARARARRRPRTSAACAPRATPAKYGSLNRRSLVSLTTSPTRPVRPVTRTARRQVGPVAQLGGRPAARPRRPAGSRCWRPESTRLAVPRLTPARRPPSRGWRPPGGAASRCARHDHLQDRSAPTPRGGRQPSRAAAPSERRRRHGGRHDRRPRRLPRASARPAPSRSRRRVAGLGALGAGTRRRRGRARGAAGVRRPLRRGRRAAPACELPDRARAARHRARRRARRPPTSGRRDVARLDRRGAACRRRRPRPPGRAARARAWALLDDVAAAAPAELRKGPRGGGRDTRRDRRGTSSRPSAPTPARSACGTRPFDVRRPRAARRHARRAWWRRTARRPRHGLAGALRDAPRRWHVLDHAVGDPGQVLTCRRAAPGRCGPAGSVRIER